MAKREFTPDAERVRLAFNYLQSELETLLALSITLTNELTPDDPDNHDDYEHTTAWRLSQVLNDKLSSTKFSKNMRLLMLGSADVSNSATEASHA